MRLLAVRVLHVGAHTHVTPCPCCGRQCACDAVDDGMPSDEVVVEFRRLSGELRASPPEEHYDPVPPRLRGQPHRGRNRKAQRGTEYSSPRGLRMHRRQGR